MKKILLCLFLLTSLNFYGQVTPIVHCFGDNIFDLTEKKAQLIDNLDPATTKVRYHLSLADATNNTNVIANPSNYNTAESSTTIYARIDNNGTFATNSFNLIVNPILTTDATIKYVNCIPTIVINGKGGDSNYEYSHAGIIFKQDNVIYNPSPGAQTVYVRDGIGCVASKSLVVESLSPLSWIANKMDPVSCQGSNDGIIQITGSGGKAPYLYSIGNNNEFTASNIFKNLDVGNYTLKIQDSTGCIISFSLNISQRYPSIAVGVVTTNDSNSTNEGKIDLIVSGGTAPYTYSLKDNNEILIPSKTTNPFTGLAAGSYEAIVTDSNGCTSSQKGINILNVSTPLTATTGVTPITCVITTGTITITPNGGILPYQYSIDNGNTYTNSNVFPNLAAGTYNIKVHDDKGTIVSIATTVEPVNLPKITTTVTNLLCNGASNGRIIIGASGGKAPNIFSINGEPYTSYNVFDNLPAGNYLASAKDSNGCVVSESVMVTAPPPITFNIKIKDKTVTVDATGGDAKNPNNYALDGGKYSTGTVFSNVSYGNHVIHVKTPNNCISSTSIEVTVPLVSTVAVDKGTITVTATGGTPLYTYSLQDPSGMPIITAQSNNIFTEVVNGSYMVVVTDSKANTSTQANINISESSLFTGTTLINPITCINPRGIITLTATGGKSPYQYSLDYGLHYTASNVFSDLPAGSYTITVRDSRNYMTAVSATVTVAKPVLVSAEIISDVSCNGGSDGRLRANVIQGQAPYLYLLDGKESQVNNTFNNLYSGVHTIKVTDDNNCTTNLSFTISEPTAPLNSTIAVNNKTITAPTTGGTPPYTYSLYDSVGLVTGPQTSDSFDNLPTGLYSLQITDVRGCTFTQNAINISELPLLSATAVITSINCNNSTGTIIVVATGGSGSYEYSLDNGINYTTSNIFTGLTPETYNINVKDSQNTTITITATINPLQTLVADAVLTKTIDCLNNASINVIASGGKKPYQYSFDNGLTYNVNNTFTNINAGTYFVNVKDSLDCTVITNSITIEQPISLSANFTTADGTITTNAKGGIAPYSYALTDNSGLTVIPFQNSNVFTGLTAGSYGIEVKDATGCTYIKTDITIVNKPNTLLATTAVTPTTCLNPTGKITVSVSGGVAPYQYSVDNGVNYISANVFTDLAPETYNIRVRDADNNTTLIVSVITPVNAPAISATVNSNVLCKGDNTGSITATATGGQAPYSYSLNGITFNTTNVFTNLRVGTYNISAKDANGCIATTTILLTEPAEDLSATAILINDQGIIVNAKGGTAPYNYYLQNNNGIVVAGPQKDGFFTRLPIGRYAAQVTDANGCGYIHWSVDVLQAPALSATVQVDSIKCNVPGTITVNPSGGFQPYYYSYDNGTTYTNSNVYSSFKPGSYTIKVRDYQNTTFSLVAMITEGSAPVINITATSINCKGEASGSITANTTGGHTPYNYSLDNGPYINGKSNMTFTNLYAGSHNITVMDTNGCLTTNQVIISEPVSALMTVTTVKNQTITINATGGVGNYRYAISPNLDKFSTSNIFSGLTPGSYMVITSDANGCYITMNAVIDPPAPLINGQIKLTLEFKSGQTLADLIIDGQNIKWYINQNPLAGKTSKTSELSLPLTTVIVDGTTYYASQTINGIESTERLAVTVKSGALGTGDLAIKNFTYYPNPVKNVLTISNTSIIDEVTFISIKGETLLSKKINGLRSEIDLSNFSNGIYFLKVKTEGKEKTVKLIKE
jgi:hypothetical protein